MSEMEFFASSFRLLDGLRALKHDLLFSRKNPDYFYPDGIWTWFGKQGSGKTLSAIRCLRSLHKAYPKALIVSNIELKGFDCPIIPFSGYEQIGETTNGTNGVIFFIDEIHVLWNSLESKNIPISEMLNFCQMRKDRRIILGTCQVYNRVAKPIREQIKYCILCHNVLKYIQYNTVVDPVPDDFRLDSDDGDLAGQIIKHTLFFHSPADYNSYDTLFKVTRNERKVKKHVR